MEYNSYREDFDNVVGKRDATVADYAFWASIKSGWHVMFEGAFNIIER